MWLFVTIHDQADPKNLADIYAALAKYVAAPKDDAGGTSMNIVIYNDEKAKYWQQMYGLPYTPIAQAWSTGPDKMGNINRAQQFYLARNDNGVIVRKTVSALKIGTGDAIPTGQSSTNGTSGKRGRAARASR